MTTRVLRVSGASSQRMDRIERCFFGRCCWFGLLQSTGAGCSACAANPGRPWVGMQLWVRGRGRVVLEVSRGACHGRSRMLARAQVLYMPGSNAKAVAKVDCPKPGSPPPKPECPSLFVTHPTHLQPRLGKGMGKVCSHSPDRTVRWASKPTLQLPPLRKGVYLANCSPPWREPRGK